MKTVCKHILLSFLTLHYCAIKLPSRGRRFSSLRTCLLTISSLSSTTQILNVALFCLKNSVDTTKIKNEKHFFCFVSSSTNFPFQAIAFETNFLIYCIQFPSIAQHLPCYALPVLIMRVSIERAHCLFMPSPFKQKFFNSSLITPMLISLLQPFGT